MENRIDQHVITNGPTTSRPRPRQRFAVEKEKESVPHARSRIKGWYQRRKRADKCLQDMTGGKVRLFGNSLPPNGRLWMQQEPCGHVFVSSLREIATMEKGRYCPFCHSTRDMTRYGSVVAVQEHVYVLSEGMVLFSADNVLRKTSDSYRFYCTIHDTWFLRSFSEFLEDPHVACNECFFELPPRLD